MAFPFSSLVFRAIRVSWAGIPRLQLSSHFKVGNAQRVRHALNLENVKLMFVRATRFCVGRNSWEANGQMALSLALRMRLKQAYSNRTILRSNKIASLIGRFGGSQNEPHPMHMIGSSEEYERHNRRN